MVLSNNFILLDLFITLYTDVITQYNERKRQLIDAKNKSTNTKLINTCKKRFQYVSCNVIDDIKAKLT